MSDSRPVQTVEPAVVERRSTGRSVAAVICVVLAALLTTPAAVAFWGQRTLNDGQRYLDTVGPLVDSPEVQDAIATKVIDAIEEQVDVEAILNEVFAGVITDRPRLQRLVGPLAGAINGLIEREVREFVASDTFADIWVTVNTRAQQRLVRILQGDDTGAVSLQGDQVVLDVGEVIDQVKQRLVARGLTIVQNVPIPDIDKQIVLLDAPQLRQARTIYAFANPLARWLIVVVVVLYLAAVLLARRRPRMTVIVGVALAANALLMALALSVGRQLFINELADSDVRPGELGVLRHAAGLPRARLEGAPLAGPDPGGRRLVHRVQRPGTAVRSTVSGGLRDRRCRAGRRAGRRCRPLGRGQRPLAAGGRRPARCRRPALGERRLAVEAGSGRWCSSSYYSPSWRSWSAPAAARSTPTPTPTTPRSRRAMPGADPEPRSPDRYAALALLVGAVLLVGWAVRFGVVTRLLSAPVLTGYLAGSARRCGPPSPSSTSWCCSERPSRSGPTCPGAARAGSPVPHPARVRTERASGCSV